MKAENCKKWKKYYNKRSIPFSTAQCIPYKLHLSENLHKAYVCNMGKQTAKIISSPMIPVSSKILTLWYLKMFQRTTFPHLKT